MDQNDRRRKADPRPEVKHSKTRGPIHQPTPNRLGEPSRNRADPSDLIEIDSDEEPQEQQGEILGGRRLTFEPIDCEHVQDIGIMQWCELGCQHADGILDIPPTYHYPDFERHKEFVRKVAVAFGVVRKPRVPKADKDGKGKKGGNVDNGDGPGGNDDGNRKRSHPDGDGGEERLTQAPRTDKYPPQSWGSILNATKFSLPKPVKSFIQDFGDDPSEFMQERVRPGYRIELSDNASKAQWRYKLGLRWDELEDIERRTDGMDAARKVYLFLFIRDLIILVNPRARTRRAGKATIDAVRKVLAYVSDGRDDEISRAAVLDQLWRRFKYGEKLHHLNAEFGDGAALALCMKLSPNFLRKNSPASDFREHAYDWLRQHDFEGVAAEAASLGVALREHLIQPFKEAWAELGAVDPRAPLVLEEEEEGDDVDDRRESDVKDAVMREILGARAAEIGTSDSEEENDTSAAARVPPSNVADEAVGEEHGARRTNMKAAKVEKKGWFNFFG